MEFNQELNNKLWKKTENKGESSYSLKPEVSKKLKEIANFFIDTNDIPKEAVKDIRIVGSSCNYNYNKYSDLDLHIVVDFDKIHKDCPIVTDYAWAIKQIFNQEHDISIYGINVEVYVESIEQEANSNGVYSLIQNKWLKVPEKIKPTKNDSAVQAKFNEIKEAIDKIEDSEYADKLLDKIYFMRKAGLESGGEFSTENLTFKLLRNGGYLDKLKAMKKKRIDKNLTLENYTNDSLWITLLEALKQYFKEEPPKDVSYVSYVIDEAEYNGYEVIDDNLTIDVTRILNTSDKDILKDISDEIYKSNREFVVIDNKYWGLRKLNSNLEWNDSLIPRITNQILEQTPNDILGKYDPYDLVYDYYGNSGILKFAENISNSPILINSDFLSRMYNLKKEIISKKNILIKEKLSKNNIGSGISSALLIKYLIENRNIERNKMKRGINESSYGMPDDIEKQVKTAIESYIAKYGDSLKLYADSGDTLSENIVKKIFESNNPKDAFYEIIGSWDWFENADYDYEYILKEKLELPEDTKEEYTAEILDMLQDYISYEIPYEHFDETVGFDVYMHDADSANREYSDMLVFTETDKQDEDGDYIKELSEINGMLAKFLATQGYTAEQFIEYYNADKSEDKFLNSLIQEIQNTNSGDGQYCQIVFLVQAPITEMAAAIQDGGTITIPKTAICGLAESFNGSGSLLGIELKQNVTGTIKEQEKPIYQANGDFEVYYKHGYTYNIDDIYGLTSSAWDSDVKFSQSKQVGEAKINKISYKSTDEDTSEVVKSARKVKNNGVNKMKKRINEDVDDIWAYLIDYGIATQKELELVTDIMGYTEETLNSVIYARTGMHNLEQLQHEYDDIDTSEALKPEEEYEFKTVRKNTLANPNLYGGRYTQKDIRAARKEYENDIRTRKNKSESLIAKKRKSSKKYSILEEAHNVLAMNETSEGGDLTTWQFSAKGFSKAGLEKQSTFGSANLRCIIHENSNGNLVGTVTTDYGMNEDQVKENLIEALRDNGFRATTITNLTLLY